MVFVVKILRIMFIFQGLTALNWMNEKGNDFKQNEKDLDKRRRRKLRFKNKEKKVTIEIALR